VSALAAQVEEPLDEPQLSVRAVAVLLLHFQKTHGAARLAEVWEKNAPGLSLEHVTTMTNFVSLRFIERVMEMLVRESGEQDFAWQAGLRTASPEALGFLYHVFRTVGSPKACYRQLVELGPTFNRVGRFDLLSLERHRLELTYTSSLPERTPYLCEGRRAQFASIPMIWGLPPAEVEERACQLRGDGCCHYVLRWSAQLRGWRAPLGLVLGLGAGAVVTAGLALPGVPWLPALAAPGLLAGLWLDARRELRAKDELLVSQNEGLKHSLRDLQRRSDEVFRANQELEVRVQARTGELSEANQKLSTALARQQEVDRLKTQFFDNVSHELRTPLTLILLTLESLQQRGEAEAPGLRQHLDRMERSAERLLRLINDLLDLARIEAGKVRLRYEAVDLGKVLPAMLIPFRVLADKKRVGLRLELEAAEPVHADPEKLDVVFQNLVSNALKFTDEGEVTVRVRQDAFWVHVEVADTGVGIGQKDLNAIFDRFAQADASGTRKFGGTGIGLALVKETVELHAGTVTVDSQPGRGSTFRVSIPRGTAHIREELRERRTTTVPIRNDRRSEGSLALKAELRGAGPAVSDGAPASPAPELPVSVSARSRILVVEDDPEIRSILVGVLGQDYDVLEARNGQEGLEVAARCRPALVISDVMMPVMSGMQLLQALRSDVDLMDTPVILLTARFQVEARAEGLEAGANDYLGKPFSPRELVARVESQLRLREATARIAQTERQAAASLITSGFAHEVRNPLNGLVNALGPLREAMGQDADPQTARAMLDVVDESVRRIRDLAESLLALVRVDPSRVPLDVSGTLRAAVRALEWKLPPAVKVVQALQAQHPVEAEAGSLTQVWINLIDNALRATGEQGQVTLSCGDEDGEVVVRVSDGGCGMAPEALARAFEPFFTTRTSGEGTGLGLALCRRIVLQHRGRIELASAPGKGTTVTVRLPPWKGEAAEA
jgi:signal transduction histidine kinase